MIRKKRSTGGTVALILQMILLEISMSNEIDEAVRQSAAINFKNGKNDMQDPIRLVFLEK